MEKLIELLREYIRPKYEFGEYGVYLNKQNKLILEEQHSFMGYGIDEEWYTDVEFGESIIISKQFGFIEWLVENDKIAIEKLEEKAERKPHYIFTTDDGRLGFKLFEVYESLLMLLSISEKPIEDLISYLK